MNEVNHTIYKTLEGEIVPSVTTVLKILNKSALLDWAWRLGRRKPNRIHSPEESATDWWWTGWVSRKEYCEYKKEE